MAHYKTNTLGELIRHRLAVRVRCDDCRRQTAYAPLVLILHLHGDRPWRSIRFRCRRCGELCRAEIM